MRIMRETRILAAFVTIAWLSIGLGTASEPDDELIFAETAERESFVSQVIVESQNPASRISKRDATNGDKKLVCYYDSPAAERPEQGKLTADNIDPFLCTHLIYNYAGLTSKHAIRFLSPKTDLAENDGLGNLQKLTNLKQINPNLKVLLSINDGSNKYGNLVASKESRDTFIQNILEVIEKHNLDGIDLAWKHPNDPRGEVKDKQNYVKLVQELKEAFEGKSYILSIAVAAGKRRIEAGYDMAELAKYATFLNLQTLDYNGGWDKETGLHVPLYGSSTYDKDETDAALNVNWSVNYILSLGTPVEKLMLGVSTYARTFTLETTSVKDINAPTSGSGLPGPYTKNDRLLGYNEVCANFKNDPDAWKIVRDSDYKSSYASKGLIWVSFDDKESLIEKTSYALAKGMAGITVSFLDTDDFTGYCSEEKYPLIKAIKKTLSA